MVNTFLKYLLTSGAILMIDFDDFLSSKRIMKYIRKRLTYLNCQQGSAFFTQKKIPRKGKHSKDRPRTPVLG